MKELKFRVWDDANKCFYYADMAELCYTSKPSDFRIFVDENPTAPVEQFAGIFDKAGKGIFEGDVIMRITNTVVWGFIGMVFSQTNGDIGWSVETSDGVWGINSNHKYEIIGNIHQDPELLK